MTSLAPYLSAFLRVHLPQERKSSPNTCEAYAYSFQLLICFAAEQLKRRPSDIEIEQLDAPLVLDFLMHLESQRGNTPRTRNARLAAINAFFRYLEFRLPICLDQAQRIHAIPTKKTDQALIGYLTRVELEALLNTPDRHSLSGIRDRAMLNLTFAAGLRVSELVGLQISAFTLGQHPSLQVIGKGRRERELPLWKETAVLLKDWLAVRQQSNAPEMFLNACGQGMSRAGFAYILSKHVAVAAQKEPTLTKKRVTPHVLRHTCAMHILQATHDARKVSLWLGHASLQSTEAYLHADPTEKLEVLEANIPPHLKRGRFKAPDKLMAMLSSITNTNNYVK